MGLAEVVLLFWSQGLKEVVIHEIKEHGLEKGEVSAAAFQLMLMGNLVLYGILAGILFLFIDEQILVILSLLCGAGIIFRSFEGFELWFHASLKIKITVWVQFIAQLIYMVAITLFILNEAGLIWFGVAYAGQLIIAGIGFAVVYAIERGRIVIFGNYQQIQHKLLRSGKYMMLAKLTLTCSFLADRFIIEYYMNMEAVGYYAAAMKMTTTWTFIGSSIALSFLPVISDSLNTQQFHSSAKEMFKWLIISSLLLVIPFFILSDQLVLLVFGSGYASSSEIFKIVVSALPFLLLNEGFKSCLVVISKTRYYIYSTSLTIVLLIIGNFILTPFYGLEGAAYAFLIAWFFGGVFVFMGFKEIRGLIIKIR